MFDRGPVQGLFLGQGALRRGELGLHRAEPGTQGSRISGIAGLGTNPAAGEPLASCPLIAVDELAQLCGQLVAFDDYVG